MLKSGPANRPFAGQTGAGRALSAQPEIHKADDPALETSGEHPHPLCEPILAHKADDYARQTLPGHYYPLSEIWVVPERLKSR